MDTSKEYIKMCDCPEIHGESVTPPYPTDYYAQRKRGATRYGYQLITADIVDDDYIWLPRQDQIQAIMGKAELAFCIYQARDKWGGEIYQDREQVFTIEMDSPEQLWLAFYMNEKHKKKWNGEKWVKQ